MNKPTGCYKCGGTGHWSRDCPSNPNTSETNNNDSNLDPITRPRPPFSAPSQKPKVKLPRRTRPKLTPDRLLSDAGVGHILRYFPPALKCRGRGHEVDDLQHLLRMYKDWHSRLIPYYNFEQFVDKVERVGATKRVKGCLRGLRDRVASGVDPTKLLEPQVQQDSVEEQGGLDMPSDFQENNIQIEDDNDMLEDIDDNDIEEDIPQSIWEHATEEPPQVVHVEDVSADSSRAEEVLNQTTEANPDNPKKIVLTEELIAQIEAKRLRALERLAARSRSSQV